MSNTKMTEVNLATLKSTVRVLEKYATLTCKGCISGHLGDCPAAEAMQLVNYFTQRINNPTRKFKF